MSGGLPDRKYPVAIHAGHSSILEEALEEGQSESVEAVEKKVVLSVFAGIIIGWGLSRFLRESKV